MKDPASLEAQQAFEDAIESAVIALEVAVMAVIARRLGKISDTTSYATIYAAMPRDMAEIRDIISKGTKNIHDTTTAQMYKAAEANDEWAAFYYAAAKKEQIPFSEHKRLNAILEKQTSEATRTIGAYCRSSVMDLQNGKNIVPIQDAYKRVVSAAATNAATGAIEPQKAIAQATRTLSNSGLRVVYASGNTRELYSAVSMNVRDAASTAMSQMREVQGLEFGADGVEVSAHVPCAADHEEYQGMRYSYLPREDYGLWREKQYEPSRPLIIGANCHHRIYPVILGVSPNAYTTEELASMRRMSSEDVTFKGLCGKNLTMSRYKASQYQRNVETSIRKMNTNAYLLEQADLPNFAGMEKATVRQYTREYRRMSAQMGLGTRMERTKAYVLR